MFLTIPFRVNIDMNDNAVFLSREVLDTEWELRVKLIKVWRCFIKLNSFNYHVDNQVRICNVIIYVNNQLRVCFMSIERR